MTDRQPKLDLGFAEECDSWLLVNTYFPSKIGGKPAWLELENLPTLDELKCQNCSEPLVFLAQLYASLDDKDDCFHRSIFVFVCRNEQCWKPNSSKNIKVLRSQLPRKNDFYSFEPPSDEVEEAPIQPKIHLCTVCGLRGPFVCSKCKNAFYCSAVHQKFDWKSRHKQECGLNITNDELSTLLFLEFEIILESESDEENPIDSMNENGNESDSEEDEANKDDYQQQIEPCQLGTMTDISESDLLPFVNPLKEDLGFERFKKSILKNPKQVLRYNRSGEPLWISEKNILKNENIEKCNRCGCDRIFEFQIMPQLLNYLKDPRMDWGVINVYTCENSCSTNRSYVEEFAYKQDIVNDN